MRIAMVSEHASPLAVAGGVDSGGQNVHVAALSAALARSGHDVRVFTRSDSVDLPPRVATVDGYTVEHVPAGPAEPIAKDELIDLMPAFGQYLGERLAAEPADIIHAHFWMSGVAAMIAGRQLAIPVAQTFHALGVVKQRHQGAADTSPPQRMATESSLCRSVDRVIATCTDEVFELRPLGLPVDRTSVVPCGVDLDRFRPEGPAVPRGALPHRVLVISRLVPRKGIEEVVRACAGIPDVELIVAGGPPESELATDREANRLRAIAAQLGVLDRVIFTGRVPHEDMPALIRSADVVAHTPWYEPFGIVPLEAMACGRPVVASAVGGLTDSVVSGVTGLLVAPRDPDQVRQALQALLDDPALREGFGAAGLARAHRRFGWDRVAAQTESVYRRTAAREQHQQVSPVGWLR